MDAFLIAWAEEVIRMLPTLALIALACAGVLGLWTLADFLGSTVYREEREAIVTALKDAFRWHLPRKKGPTLPPEWKLRDGSHLSRALREGRRER